LSSFLCIFVRLLCRFVNILKSARHRESENQCFIY